MTRFLYVILQYLLGRELLYTGFLQHKAWLRLTFSPFCPQKGLTVSLSLTKKCICTMYKCLNYQCLQPYILSLCTENNCRVFMRPFLANSSLLSCFRQERWFVYDYYQHFLFCLHSYF